MGKVDFEKMELEIFGSVKRVVKVRRTKENKRIRPNAHKRHDPTLLEDALLDPLEIYSSTDMEWMSINYRMEKAARLSQSKRRIILVMFSQEF